VVKAGKKEPEKKGSHEKKWLVGCSHQSGGEARKGRKKEKENVEPVKRKRKRVGREKKGAQKKTR